MADYVITATDREKNRRIAIAGPMSQAEANSWTPTSLDRKYYKYFKIAKHPYKGGKK